MVARFTFIKPELTFLHIQKVAKLLEQYYFHVQLLPVLSMLQLFAKDVIRDSIAEKTYMLQKARVLLNLGLTGATRVPALAYLAGAGVFGAQAAGAALSIKVFDKKAARYEEKDFSDAKPDKKTEAAAADN